MKRGDDELKRREGWEKKEEKKEKKVDAEWRKERKMLRMAGAMRDNNYIEIFLTNQRKASNK